MSVARGACYSDSCEPYFSRYEPCTSSRRSRKFFAQVRNAASMSAHFLNPLSPLNHRRPPLPVTNATCLSPDVESSISPSILTLPTLSLGTARPTPGTVAAETATAPPLTAAFFLPPVGSTFVIATFNSRTSGPGVVTIWYRPDFVSSSVTRWQPRSTGRKWTLR